MSEHIKIDIAALRKIGWDHWDPIGIRQLDDSASRTTQPMNTTPISFRPPT
ncbi:hypothetical protein [Rhizobium laguerreae]|uniref:hypothetical protein n=1 Tax=Rhizobium laguerreae TaxID=1076926 RepID=UPI0021B09391|nr:hypothetical protein [Rhizobium laguerreae]